MPVFIVMNHMEIRKIFVMKKIFLLILLLVFSASQSPAGDYYGVKINQRSTGPNPWDIQPEYYLYRLNADEPSGTLIGQIPIPLGNVITPSGTFLDKNTGELFIDNNTSTSHIYNPKTNTFRAVEEHPDLSNYQQRYEIPDTILDDMIRVENDGAVHIGENSLVTVEQNGRQYLYGTDASGSMIDIDIKSGSDFRIHGISVLDSLRGLGDGVEGSAALTAALSSVPSSAPDYEYYCGGGLGAYGSSQAAALGCAKDHSETLSFHAGASYLLGGGEAYGVDEFSDFAFKAGFTYKFGKKSKSNPVETASINAAALSASSKVEQTKLKAQVNDLSHKLAMMEKKLEVITASMDLGSHMDKLAMAR